MTKESERLFKEFLLVVAIAKSEGRAAPDDVRAAVDRFFCTRDTIISQSGIIIPGLPRRDRRYAIRHFVRVLAMGRVIDVSTASPHNANAAA